MAEAKRDGNFVTTLIGVSSVDGVTPVTVYVDPVTHRLKVDLAGGGTGSVTTVSVVSANGFAGTVANATSTPAITLSTTVTGILRGNGTTMAAVTIGSGLSYDGTTLSATGGGTVDTVVGTTDRITVDSTDPANPIVNIATGYVGQNTITTLGTVTTGTWNATAIALNKITALTASRAVVSDGSGFLAASATTATEIGYVNGVTSAIQTQLNAKQATITFGTGVLTALGVNVGTAGSIVVDGGALGTPSSGTVTNLTGTASININGTVGATTPTTGSFTSVTTSGAIELGNASDTTLSRSAAGVLAVEGVVVPTVSSTNTLTNKRITKRTGTTTSSATPTINTDNVDYFSITAQAEAITSFTTNLSGTPTLAQQLRIDVTGTAARAITWGASFANGPVALPTTTVTTTKLYVLLEWDGSIWRCMASGSTV